jgi:metallo-beta-lactamase family protein
MSTVTFLGAARNVTGSRTLVETDSSRVLVDCGLHQEWHLRERDWAAFPVPPSTIRAVIITHAHLDHCGYLPRLVRKGFSGQIFCTPPTAAIAQAALLDSAAIMEEEADRKRRRHEAEGRQGPFPEEPLYTDDDVRKVLPRFTTVPYSRPFTCARGVTAAFHNAAHILGSSAVELVVGQGKKQRRLLFSGDIGREGNPLLAGPDVPDHPDLVFMEATYGNRDHETYDEAAGKLQHVVSETFARKGNVVIPILAIERAEEIIFSLKRSIREGSLPRLQAFIDSPLAIEVLSIYKRFPRFLDRKLGAAVNRGQDPFTFPGLTLTETNGESKEINRHQKGAIIMAGSGMCAGGRIKHHLIHNIERAACTILFVSYQSRGTLGREIAEGAEKVRIFGRFYSVNARVEKIDGFSGHADRSELMDWVAQLRKKPERIFVVHAEKESADEFAAAVRDKFGIETAVPDYGETRDIG